MNNATIILVILAAIFLSGCGEDNAKNKFIRDAGFEAYLKFKRIPVGDDQKVASALIVYNERVAVSKAIEKTGLLDTDMITIEVEEFRKQMLISRYFEAFVQENVTKDAVKNYYNTNAEEFERRKIRVAHILFRTNSRMTDDEKNARLLKAKEAYARLQKNEKFEDLVKEYSDDKLSVQKDGDLGWLEEGAVDPIFSRTVFNLTEDKISKPFATSYGYHIVKVLEPAAVIKTPFERVEGDITYKLKQQAKEGEMKRLKELAGK